MDGDREEEGGRKGRMVMEKKEVMTEAQVDGQHQG